MADSDQPRTATTRRALLEAGGATTLLFAVGIPVRAQQIPVMRAAAGPPAPTVRVMLSVNGREYPLNLDTRTSLLDALREHLSLTGSKKGCDHGQCGACTVLVNGRRINACLTLAVMHQADKIETVEGLAADDELHPVQAAFVTRDAFQCGYCTPGQICSAVGMLREAEAGWPSQVTSDVATQKVSLSDEEIRERMSGNICRCSAYPQIVAAVRDAANGVGL
jgi:xanthine dehydrogenase YagT iron-sulfur-binding subunit